MVEAVAESLQKMQISSLTPKMAVGTKGTPMELRTNSVRLNIKPNISFFKYDVRMHELYPGKDDGPNKEKEITKQTRNDFNEQDRKEKTVKIYKILCAKKVLPPMEELVYDRAAILFSTKKLPYDEAGKSFTIPPADLIANKVSISHDSKGVRVDIKQCADSFQCSSNDLKNAVSTRAEEQDRGILEVLNLMTSQGTFFEPGKFIVYGNNSAYLYDPSQFGFTERDLPELREGKYMGVGTSKSVKILEGKDPKNPSAFVTVDVAKAAFHIDEMKAIDKICLLGNTTVQQLAQRLSVAGTKKMIEKGVKGMTFLTTHCGAKNHIFTCSGIGKPASECKFKDANGKVSSVVDYYRSKYNLALKNPHLNVFTSLKGNMYPPEVLVVAKNQRVAQQQQTPAQVQVSVRACAVAPSIRLTQTERLLGALEMTPGKPNARLEKMFVNVAPEQVTVNSRITNGVIVMDKKGKKELSGNCKWNTDQAILAALMSNWGACSVLTPQDANVQGVFEHFVNVFQQTAKTLGMSVTLPKFMRHIGAHDLERLFVDAKANGILYLLFVSSDVLTHHDYIKFLERKYEIVTQNVRYSRARDTSKRDTMKSIIMKTNMKNGGLNYMVQDSLKMLPTQGPGLLICGIEFTHPPPCLPGREPTIPSAMGWSANCTKQLQQFVGGYHFISPRSSDDATELRASIKKLFTDAAMGYKTAHGRPASTILIYRNGVSEGQYNKVMDLELSAIKQAFHDMSNGQYNPEVVILAVSKDHKHRLYKKQPGNGKPAEQNIAPGTIVDSGIVNPALNEFFLNSHSAFQGTAKTPKYTLLVNGKSNKLMSNDQLQSVTHGLCFLHGIISSTVSVPAPLKVASEMAKRGIANYKQRYGDSSSNGEGPMNLEEANCELGYSGTSLAGRRFNA